MLTSAWHKANYGDMHVCMHVVSHIYSQLQLMITAVLDELLKLS